MGPDPDMDAKMNSKTHLIFCRFSTVIRVADPYHFDADPDPACHFDADPDPTNHFFPDSDPPML